MMKENIKKASPRKNGIKITHYIVSDTHLANGGRRDDFKKNRTRFKSFLQMVKKEKAQLIIAGDFLELWQVNARGQCTLKYWPTQRPVKKLLDKE